MSVGSSFKGAALKAALGKLQDGNSGSTALGAVSLAVLSAGVDFGRLFDSSDSTKQGTEWGKVAAALVLGVWGYFIGRKAKPANQ